MPRPRPTGASRSLRRAVERLLREELRVTAVHQVCARCGGSDHGRPQIRVSEGDPPYVSWSYAPGCALVGWTWVAPIGVDIEPEGPHVAGVGDRAAWTRAEAVLKATGEGLTRPLATVHAEDGDHTDIAWTSQLRLAGHVAHVAVLGRHPVPPPVSWRLVGPGAPAR